MKILFVSSGNNKFGISPIVYNQGESLRKMRLEIEYQTVKGKGLPGYLNNIPQIRKKVKTKDYDLIHAHYSLSALTTTLSHPGIPIVVSLMGTDSKMSLFWKTAIKLSNRLFWQHTIAKSEEMKSSLNLKYASVIPNGVDLIKFAYRDKTESRSKLGFSKNKKYILFLSNPERVEKNYPLAKRAVALLNDMNIKLLPIYNIPHDEIIDYLYATDLLLMTSLWEGSPNAVKEAMACNCPIVSTDVGDVKWVTGNTEGCYITSFGPDDVAQKIEMALDFVDRYGRTHGRERITELGLDSYSIAKRIIEVYRNVLKKN